MAHINHSEEPYIIFNEALFKAKQLLRFYFCKKKKKRKFYDVNLDDCKRI